MTHKYQALRDATQGIPECDSLEDDEFFSMLEELVDSDDFGATEEDLNAIAGISDKYKDDPRWKAFIQSVLAGPDFSSGDDAITQFDKLVAALPKEEQEAAKRVEQAMVGS